MDFTVLEVITLVSVEVAVTAAVVKVAVAVAAVAARGLHLPTRARVMKATALLVLMKNRCRGGYTKK